jgi:hypothetical protein
MSCRTSIKPENLSHRINKDKEFNIGTEAAPMASERNPPEGAVRAIAPTRPDAQVDKEDVPIGSWWAYRRRWSDLFQQGHQPSEAELTDIAAAFEAVVELDLGRDIECALEDLLTNAHSVAGHYNQAIGE